MYGKNVGCDSVHVTFFRMLIVYECNESSRSSNFMHGCCLGN